jgi:autophagy-related protein 2
MSEFSSALSEAGGHSEGSFFTFLFVIIFGLFLIISFFMLEEEGGKSSMNTPIAVPVMGVAGEVISPTMGSRDFPNQPDSISSADSSDLAVSPPIYFRSFIFSPDVLIRFDYHGKGVDLSQGPSFSGLLVGLGQLNCSQLTLKRLSHRHG